MQNSKLKLSSLILIIFLTFIQSTAYAENSYSPFIIPVENSFIRNNDMRLFYMQDAHSRTYNLGFEFYFESLQEEKERRERELEWLRQQCLDSASNSKSSCMERTYDRGLIRELVVSGGTVFFGAIATPTIGGLFFTVGSAINARDTARELVQCERQFTRDVGKCRN